MHAVLIGWGITEQAGELGRYGVDKVYVVDDPALEHYVPETFGAVARDVVESLRPAAVVLAASDDGKDLAARLSGLLDVGLVQDCIEIGSKTD